MSTLEEVLEKIDRLSTVEKKIIYKKLKEDINERIQDIFDMVAENNENEKGNISFEDITEEVEKVRSERHEKN